MLRIRLRWGVLLTMLLGAGCGGPNTPVKVRGVVLLDDKPIPGAMVTYIPLAGNGRQAQGFTQADGSFQLTTFQPNDGALPGSYKITVQVLDAVEVPGGAASSRQGMEAAAKAQQGQKPSRFKLPSGYGDPARTPLKGQVPPDGKVTLQLLSQQP